MSCGFNAIERIILSHDADEKCAATHHLHSHFNDYEFNHDHHPNGIATPGYPLALELVAPKSLKRRGISSQVGRNVLLHAIAHIEFNAINLALDAAYRFRNQPEQFYRDWIQVADDEARHFAMIRQYLNQHDCEYGHYPAHNGLWEMAVSTQHDIVARMALVPRVLEARGLDVTPGIIQRLDNVNDHKAVEILKVIYQDEIGHVDIGSRWFFYHCQQRELEPRSTFLKMVETHLHGELRGPFNISARLQAGFDQMEMRAIDAKYGAQ